MFSIARAIQEELLNAFSSRNNLSYWYDREDTTPIAVVKKPNPRNIQNAEKLQQLEAELARYVYLCFKVPQQRANEYF